MKDKIYTISTAHLDTSWLWTQKETVNTYLPRTIKYNFDYFKMYPNYKFNFEGSYRYKLIEEYHKEDFEKIKEYIKSGHWNICGSTYENGDVNIPSPEALIRNILYGNAYFMEKFGRKCNDIFLPDCFGFGRALPQVMSHSGLLGFTTQKLSWGCSIEPPFEFGKWKGLDDSFVYTSLKPGNYSTVVKEVRSKYHADRIENNKKECNIPATMMFYGTGDRGGAPKECAIEQVFKELNDNNNQNSEIISGSIVDFYNELKLMDQKGASLKEFDKEFLMISHGPGSYTARTASKRLNKQCENILDMCEKVNSLSSILGVKKYPEERINEAWEKVLEHHFHDDITGTSFMECYKKNWNDYYLTLYNSIDEFSSSISSLEKMFDTSKLSNPILVFNPNQDTQTKTIKLDIDLPYERVKVFDLKGVEYPAVYQDNSLYFTAVIKGNTLKVFDISEGKNLDINNSLKCTKNSLENDRYKITLDSELNIDSIYDKTLKKELLSSPIRYELYRDISSMEYPAWEIKYEDISKKPYGYFKDGSVKIVEDNSLRVSLEINKKFNKSTLKEIITLDKGSNRIDVYNNLCWHEDATLLKVSFPLSVSSPNGLYDIGISKYPRPTNTSKLYEVPAQKFGRIENDLIGISILSDSRQGFDKPNENTLRLTAVTTPFASMRHECSQHLLDFGENIFTYSICSSSISSDNSIIEAEALTKPINVFKMGLHKGELSGDLTTFTLSNNEARVMCFKKALNENKYILRVVDYYGKGLKDAKIEFIKNIKSIQLVNGQEEFISDLSYDKNQFTFSLNHNEIKSFMIEFETEQENEDFCFATLPLDKVAITSNANRNKANIKNKVSIPKELLSSNILYSKGIPYKLELEGNSALNFNGQEIKLDRKYKYAYLLIINQGKDKEISINNQKIQLQNSFDRLACADLYALKEYGFTKDIHPAFTFTHYHKGSKDIVLEDLYLYSIKLEISRDTLTLPKDSNISLLALTYSSFDNTIKCDTQMIDILRKRKFDYKLTKEELKYAREPFNQIIRDIFIDRRKTKYVDWYGGHCMQSPSDYYQLEVFHKDEKRIKNIKFDE